MLLLPMLPRSLQGRATTLLPAVELPRCSRRATSPICGLLSRWRMEMAEVWGVWGRLDRMAGKTAWKVRA